MQNAFFTRYGETAVIAYNRYDRYETDLDLLVTLGIRHYHLPMTWSRITQIGRGQVNVAGLDFFSHPIDTALARCITPFVTIDPWDHP